MAFADEKAETSQQDVLDYVFGDESPTKVLSKSDAKKKSELMEESSGRAVQRVLDDEMLHVVRVLCNSPDFRGGLFYKVVAAELCLWPMADGLSVGEFN